MARPRKRTFPDLMMQVVKFISAKRTQNFLFMALVFVVGGMLLLWRLDDMYLWQDEAETALVSRHLLTYGLPLATNGRDWVQQTDLMSESFNKSYVWTWHAWLQFALTALSFALLGPTTFAARLPFVLVGLLSLCFFYWFVLGWLGDRRVARLATILLLFCVPFLLHLRQCRYYALAAFFTLLTLDAYRHLRAGKRWAVPYFVLSATLLYHGHFGAFFPTLAALGLHLLVRRVHGRVLQHLLVSFALIILLALPWMRFMQVWSHRQELQWSRSLSHLIQFSLYITVWIFPLILAGVLVVAWLRRSTKASLALNQSQAAFCELAGVVIVVNLLSLAATAFFDTVFFRYVVHLIPLLLVMLAIVVLLVIESCTIGGHALLFVLLATNAVHITPYSLPGLRHITWSSFRPTSTALIVIDDLWMKAHVLRSELLMYAHELTNAYEGPTEGLVKYLSVHAQPGQTVVANYEELPLMFYTNLRVWGGLAGHGVTPDLQPDWIIDRKDGPYRDVLAAMVAAGSYQLIQLPHADIHWENRPEPGNHHYLTVQSVHQLTLYRRCSDETD